MVPWISTKWLLVTKYPDLSKKPVPIIEVSSSILLTTFTIFVLINSAAWDESLVVNGYNCSIALTSIGSCIFLLLWYINWINNGI